MLAELRDALKCAGSKNVRLRRMAVMWIMDDENDGYMSFKFICDYFGLSVEAIREELVKVKLR